MATTGTAERSWFQVVQGDDLEQGDLLQGMPRFIMPAVAAVPSAPFPVQVETVDAVVMTQSCDLAFRSDGSCKARNGLLCPIFFKRNFKPEQRFGKDEAWEEARQGRNVFYHVLNRCELPGHELDFILVDFHDVFSLTVEAVRSVARSAGARLRLNPPYREHLSQAFARVFMRVGLPSDIPPFGKKK